jgi:hypothetical protein
LLATVRWLEVTDTDDALELFDVFVPSAAAPPWPSPARTCSAGSWRGRAVTTSAPFPAYELSVAVDDCATESRGVPADGRGTG